MVTSHSTGPVLESPEEVGVADHQVRQRHTAHLPHLLPVRKTARRQPGPRQLNLQLSQPSPALSQLQGSRGGGNQERLGDRVSDVM